MNYMGQPRRRRGQEIKLQNFTEIHFSALRAGPKDSHHEEFLALVGLVVVMRFAYRHYQKYREYEAAAKCWRTAKGGDSSQG